MQRTPLIAANWKMNGSAALVDEMVKVLGALALAEQAVVICPPATLLTRFPPRCNFALGGQTVSHETGGAFFERPPWALIEALDDLFAGAKPAGSDQ